MLYLLMVCAVLVWELRAQRGHDPVNTRGRTLANALLGVVGLCVHSTGLLLAGWLAGSPQGPWSHHLIDLTGWSMAAQLPVHLLLLTFLGYWMHRLMHASDLLWRVHRVHHADGTVSPSTAFRHHPLESAINLLPAWLLNGVVAVDPQVMYFVACMLLMVGIMQHAGLRWSPAIEQGWSWLVPTPACHWVHHEEAYGPSNHNFGDHFPLWDKLFGTFMPPRPRGTLGIVHGVPGMTHLNAAELTESVFRRV